MRRPGLPKVNHDPIREMEVFDSLPATIRAALNDSPVKYLEIAGLRFAIETYGLDQTAQMIRTGRLPATVVDADCN
jgi:hypothetical protein